MSQPSSNQPPDRPLSNRGESAPRGEETLATRRLYEGTVVKLRVDRVRMSKGPEVFREVVEHSGAVTVVALDGEGRLLLVRQHRHATGRALLELPAGTLDREEEPEACAVRELEEETGFRAGHLQRLGGFFVAPGYCTEYIHAYFATDLKPGTAGGDEDEDIEVLALPLDEVVRLIETGELEDAKSLAALFLYLHRRGGS
jgi:nudix-type nucleoside diphosphatase (YffH/AdpP family)